MSRLQAVSVDAPLGPERPRAPADWDNPGLHASRSSHVLVVALVALLVDGVVYLADDQLWLTPVEPPMRYPRSFSKPARSFLGDEKFNSLHEVLAKPRCSRGPLRSARSGAFLRSLCLASCFLSRSPALLLYRHGIKPRRWLRRIPQIIAGKLTMPPGPVPLRRPRYQDGTKMRLGPELNRGP